MSTLVDIGLYLRQLAPHQKERQAAILLKDAQGVISEGDYALLNRVIISLILIFIFIFQPFILGKAAASEIELANKGSRSVNAVLIGIGDYPEEKNAFIGAAAPAYGLSDTRAEWKFWADGFTWFKHRLGKLQILPFRWRPEFFLFSGDNFNTMRNACNFSFGITSVCNTIFNNTGETKKFNPYASNDYARSMGSDKFASGELESFIGGIPQFVSISSKKAGNDRQRQSCQGENACETNEPPVLRRLLIAFFSLICTSLITFFYCDWAIEGHGKRRFFGFVMLSLGILIGFAGMALLFITGFRWSWGWLL